MAVSISVSITQNSQNTTNNTSNVTVKVKASWTYGSYNADASSTSGSYCTIDGTKYSFTSAFNTGMTTSGSTTIYSKTLNIEHDADGSKSLTVKASYNTDVSSGTVTATKTKTLTTIPRASQPTVENADGDVISSCKMGDTIYICTNRKSTSFTHKVSYSFGGSSGKTAGISTYSGLNTRASFVPPTSLGDLIPSSTYGTCTVTMKTYKGDDLIGTKTTSFKLYVPDDAYPTIKAVTVRDDTGALETYGNCVQGKSTVSVSITDDGTYGATIKSRKTVVDGVTYTSKSFTTGAISTLGSLTVKTTVTDTRGRTASRTGYTGEFIAYTAPTINSLTAERCDADGTVNLEGSHMIITADTTVTPLNDINSNSVELLYKATNGEWATATTNNTYQGITSAIVPADPDSAYEVKCVVTDDFTIENPVERTADVQTVFTLVDYHSSGTGMTVGKVAEHENLFEVALPTRFTGTVDMFPVGSVFVTATNESPASRLGGTWELVDKYLKRTYYSSNEDADIITLGSSTSSASVTITVDGHSVIIKCYATFTGAFLETNRTALAINYENIGMTRITEAVIGHGGSDDGNAVVIGTLAYTSGNVVYAQAVTVDGSSIPANTEVHLTFNAYTGMNYILDDFCDKFYWKRTE